VLLATVPLLLPVTVNTSIELGSQGDTRPAMNSGLESPSPFLAAMGRRAFSLFHLPIVMNMKKTSSLFLIAGLAGLGSNMAAAEVPTLAEVTITESQFKLSVPYQESPQTVSTVSSNDIESRNYRTVEEALTQISSVQSGIAGRAGYDEFMIRGFTQSAYQFKNGLRLDPGYLQQEELFGLERIEVLKGPSSVEYGQIAPGGLVNMVSKKPQVEPIRAVELEGDSFNSYRFAADIGDKMTSDGEWTYRLPMVFSDSRDYQDYVYSKRQYVAPTVAYRPNAATSLVFYSAYQNDEFRRSVSVPFALYPLIQKSTYLGNPSLPSFTRPQTQIGYSFDHVFDNGLRFSHKLRQTNYDLTGTTFSPSVSATPGQVGLWAYYFNRKANILSVDNQLEKTFKGDLVEHTVMAGYDQMSYKVDKSNVSTDLDDINYVSPSYETVLTPSLVPRGTDKIQQQGLYAQYRAKIGDRYAVYFGVRNSRVLNESFSNAGQLSSQSSLGKNTYSAGLTAFNIGGFSPFASYSQSFEPITGWDEYMFDGRDKPTVSEGSQREVGVRWKSQDGRHTMVASYFDVYQTNIYNYVGWGISEGCAVDDAGCDAASDQRHQGFELESTSRFNSGIDLKLSYTKLDAVIASTQLASASGAVGSRPFGIPAETASATVVLRGSLIGFNNMELIGGARLVGDRVANMAGDRLPGYATFDLGVKYYFSKLTAYASVKNITNQNYMVGPYFGNVNYGAPRTFNFGLKYEL
jgi:iron complex outermembrane receptor protein